MDREVMTLYGLLKSVRKERLDEFSQQKKEIKKISLVGISTRNRT